MGQYQGFNNNSNYRTPQDKRMFRIILLSIIGFVFVLVLIAGISFLLSLETKEKTMVPDCVGIDLANALIKLQERGMYAEIQLRYSENRDDKGTVLGQMPMAGSIVRTGSEIDLLVSQGAIIEEIENYVGWNLDDLQVHIKSLGAIYGPLLEISTVIREYDDSPAGTILAQDPTPGTEISANTELNLRVSKGPKGALIVAPDYVDMPYEDVLNDIIQKKLLFSFLYRDAKGDETPGTVVSQTPSPEVEMPVDTIMQFVIAAPEDIEENYVFGILEKNLPDYDISPELTVDVISPMGERSLLCKLNHPGGLFTIPYLVEDGSTIVVSIEDSEKIREIVKKESE